MSLFFLQEVYKDLINQDREGEGMEKIILSPPLSNLRVCKIERTTRVLGSYTLKRRRGLWRVLTTLRKVEGGWTNNVGLRNGGAKSIPNTEDLISISALGEDDWADLIPELTERDRVLGVEINISCPNADVKGVSKEVIDRLKARFSFLVVKTPHAPPFDLYLRLLDIGVDCLHISNTKPTEKGALSGRPLMERNLEDIRKIKSECRQVKVIGGGGIYDLEAIDKYQSAGADHFSLSTILLNPLKARKLVRDYYERERKL